MSKKVFAKHRFITEDEDLIEICKILDILSSTDYEIYKKLQKVVNNMIRKQLKEDCLIGLCPHKEGTNVLICLYDIKATENNYFDQGFDEEKKEFFLKFPEEEIS